MTERVLGEAGSTKRKRFLLLPLLVTTAFALFWITGAQAVHDIGLFELDKNATNNLSTSKLGVLQANINATVSPIVVCETAGASPGTSFTILVEAEEMNVSARAPINGGAGGCSTKASYTVSRAANGTNGAAHQKADDVTLLVEESKPGPDWDQVFEEIDADADSKCLDLGLVECAYAHDGVGESIFTGGSSKDFAPIGGWLHKSGSVSGKSEIMNAYAAKDIVVGNPPGPAADGDQILYFGADRQAVDGSTDFGFWFFRNPVVKNDDGTFTGEHSGTLAVPGDILILGTFTQGGAETTIRVFRWVGAGGNESGTIQGPDADFLDCIPDAPDPPLTADNGCATVNNTTIAVDWEYTAKNEAVGGWVPAGGFLEGGVNLTKIGLDGCFSSFLVETRSSPSIPAILEDFSLGTFEACGVGITTTPTDEEDNPTDEITLGDSIYDHAEVQGTGGGPDPTGDVTFYICAPDELDGAGDDDVNTCDVGGTPVPNTDPVTPVALDGGTDEDDALATADSALFEPDEAGTWCWRGEYSGDDVYDAATDASTGECFEVVDTSSIVTDQTWVPNDTATITSAGGSSLTGTLTFTLYDNAICDPGEADANVLYQEAITLSAVASGTPQTTTNGDESGTGLAADEIFDESDSTVGPLSWKAVFNSDVDSADSEGPCETTSSFDIDDNDPTP